MFHERKWKKWKKIKMRVRQYKTLIDWRKWRTYVQKKKKCFQKKQNAFQFCMKKELKFLKKKIQNTREKVAESLDFGEIVILLE